MGDIHILKVDVGKQVGVHQQHCVVCEVIYERERADSAQAARLFHTLHLHSGNRLCEVLLKLLGEIVHGDADVGHSVACKRLNVVVDDALVADFQQRFGRFERHGA